MKPKVKIWYRDLYQAGGAIVDVTSCRDRALGINAYSGARTVLDSGGVIQGYQMYADVISAQSNIYVADHEGKIVSSNKDSVIGFSYY